MIKKLLVFQKNIILIYIKDFLKLDIICFKFLDFFIYVFNIIHKSQLFICVYILFNFTLCILFNKWILYFFKYILILFFKNINFFSKQCFLKNNHFLYFILYCIHSFRFFICKLEC